jgi:hypothetical protein
MEWMQDHAKKNGRVLSRIRDLSGMAPQNVPETGRTDKRRVVVGTLFRLLMAMLG